MQLRAWHQRPQTHQKNSQYPLHHQQNLYDQSLRRLLQRSQTLVLLLLLLHPDQFPDLLRRLLLFLQLLRMSDQLRRLQLLSDLLTQLLQLLQLPDLLLPSRPL